MTRIATLGPPHHVTERDNRGERIVFKLADYAL